MRLLNAATRRLEYFNSECDVPGDYAILSHTWGEEEVSFDDVRCGEGVSEKIGDRKIALSCLQALQDGLRYVWVDTCCIDKSSSAELAEAINSMFRWYQNAKICYVYLSDVDFDYARLSLATLISPLHGSELAVMPLGLGRSLLDIKKCCWLRSHVVQFCNSRWFTRGWTLQELIAPTDVRFYDSTWRFLGDKMKLVDTLYTITRIDTDILRDPAGLAHKSVAKRMAWASTRCTTREEDRAYSLLGIFGVNLPLIYGEGSNAFQRLQEEIIRSSKADHSILAWTPPSGPSNTSGALHSGPFVNVLSSSPYGFRHAHDIVSWALPHAETFALSHNGLRISLHAKSDAVNDMVEDSEFVDAALNCRYAHQPMTHITFYLRRRPRVDVLGTLRRPRPSQEEVLYDRTYWHTSDYPLFKCVSTQSIALNFSSMEMTMAKKPATFPDHGNKVHFPQSDDSSVCVEPYSKGCWDDQNSVLALGHPDADYRSHGSMMVRLRSIQPGSAEDVNIPIEETYLANIEAENLGVSFRAKPLTQSLTIKSLSMVRQSTFMKPGETQSIGVSDTTSFKLFANYVIMAGEMVWSLKIMASNDLQGEPPPSLCETSNTEPSGKDGATEGAISKGVGLVPRTKLSTFLTSS